MGNGNTDTVNDCATRLDSGVDGGQMMAKKYICDNEGNVIDCVEEVGIFEYSPTHDLEWLKRMCALRMTSNPVFDYDKGKNVGLDYVIELIERGMTKHE